MPEMPEVEQVRKTLLPHIKDKTIKAVQVDLARLIKYPQPQAFIDGLVGSKITDVGRRGKYLVLQIGDEKQLIVHLRMTGSLVAQGSEAPAPAYAKIKFELSDGVTMWFCDIRTFGTLYLVTNHDVYISGYETLGPEPLSPGFTVDYLQNCVLKSKKPVKSLILEQTVIAGLGNIYADESLILAGILPQRTASTLTAEEVEKLHSAINSVIAKGIANRGTTFRDYKDGEGNKGDNQNSLLAYGRHGQPCKLCGTLLEKTKVGGRGTSYCPLCQK